MAQLHVDFLLVAEFDIDKGPTLAHQYPVPLSSDSTVLAELMLPDQTHVRTEDWTIFFLHRSTATENGTEQVAAIPDEGISADDGSLMYVLNLVNTKHDKTVKRGAQVKALAVVTRHAYLHIYKPVLLLALDEYYKNPAIETLEALYRSLNAMNLDAMPKYNNLEKLILVASDQQAVLQHPHESLAMAKCISDQSLIASPISATSDRVSQGVLGSINNNGLSSPSMPTYQRDTQHFSSTIEYQNVKVPVRIPLAGFPEIVGDFSVIQLINIFSKNASTAPAFQMLHPELTTSGPSTHPIMVLINALLTQKRIIFLGGSKPSGEVAQHVLAACALGSGDCGLLRGFVERAFPYTDLSKVDHLRDVSGFIAGVTNSVFELHPEWWDILCNLDTGQITISSELQNSTVEPSPTGSVFNFSSLAVSNNSEHSQTGSHLRDYSDAGFMADIELTIQERASEHIVRMKFRDWMHRFVKIAGAYELDHYGKTQLLPPVEISRDFEVSGAGWVWPDDQARQNDLLSNTSRIEGWRGTTSYDRYAKEQSAYWCGQKAASLSIDPKISDNARIVTMDLWHQVERLRVLSQDMLSIDDSAQIYTTLAKEIRTPLHITELLSICPLSQDGLQWLAHGCWHPRGSARAAAVDLLDRIEQHAIGVHFVAALNIYFRLGYQRIKAEVASSRAPIRQEPAEGLSTGS